MTLAGRDIGKLGHTVRLIAPAYSKPLVRRQKNNTADTDAICDASLRPGMCVARDFLVPQRTQGINALQGHLSERAPGPINRQQLDETHEAASQKHFTNWPRRKPRRH